ncbi:MAG TPA: zinc-ribbon domain-containing protein [Tepidisphaeraceae bacterium]|jgi:hypothetical protein|nr:zinc-ribbon domain-containing protein [Tepidisphaeraceae bacterium]
MPKLVVIILLICEIAGLTAFGVFPKGLIFHIPNHSTAVFAWDFGIFALEGSNYSGGGIWLIWRRTAFLVFGSLPLISGIVFLEGRRVMRAHRRKTGHCPHCGYDIRESRVRCPECGSDLAE